MKGIPPNMHRERDYRRDHGRLVKSKMYAAERFIEIAPAECPKGVRGGLTPRQWLTLSPDERRVHALSNARKQATEELRVRYGHDPRPSLTMAELSARTVELADRNAEDLKQILNGSPEQVAEIITASMPRLRGDAFERLTQKYKIISH